MSRYNNYNNANGRVIKADNARILCVADIRGQLSSLNQLASQYDATHILHTGDFGFYDSTSLERMTDKRLRHVIQYSPLISPQARSSSFNTHPNNDIANLRRAVQASEQNVVSELQDFLEGKKQLNVPVYTVWGASEDVRVLEKFKSQEYKIDNLNIVDESASKLLSVGGLNIRLLGLGGSVIPHKLFDIGEGKSTIAGGQGTMWTTVLQIGELIHTADRTFSRSETRILMTHHSPGREGLLSQLAHTIKADFTISAGLHFRYGTSYNDISVSPSPAHFAQKLAASRVNFMSIYDVVKPELSNLLTAQQSQLLNSVLSMVEAMPTATNDTGSSMEAIFKDTWNFNLPDAHFGSLLLDVKDGRVSQEMRSQGFNFSYRKPTDNKVDREKQRTNSQAQIPTQQDSKSRTQPQVPTIQAPKPQGSQLNQAQKLDKAITPPAPKQKAKPAPNVPASTATTNHKNGGSEELPPQPAMADDQAESQRVLQQVAADTPLPAQVPTPGPDAAPSSEQSSQPGLWVSPCPSSDRAKELFPKSISANLKQTNAGRQYAYVFFSSTEDMKEALSSWEQVQNKEGVLVKEMQTHGKNRIPMKAGGGRGRGSFRGRGGRGRGGASTGTSTAPAAA